MPENLGFGDPLHDPKAADLDIVFVHGLYGNREGTWTRNDVLWPRALLPKAIPSGRILSFGYDANVTNRYSLPSEETITHHADSLVAELVGLRSRTNTADRPIMFIAHSLGGLVCAKAVLRAEGNPIGDSQNIESNTRRIAFLGTPFRGSKKATWAEIIRKVVSVVKRTQQTVIQDLQPGANLDLNRDLVKWLNRRKTCAISEVDIVCFFEAQATSFAFLESEKIVSQDSAEILGYDILPINADHVNMCKFDSETDSNYRKVVDVLERWAKEIRCSQEKPPHEPQPGPHFTNSGTNSGWQFNSVSGGTIAKNFDHLECPSVKALYRLRYKPGIISPSWTN